MTTVNDIYAVALSYIGETSTTMPDLNGFVLGWINQLLQEALPYENSVRERNEDTLLTTAPTLTSLTDTVSYCDDITRIALPYGLAVYIYQDDDDKQFSIMYRQKFINALKDAEKYNAEDIEDEYDVDEDEE